MRKFIEKKPIKQISIFAVTGACLLITGEVFLGKCYPQKTYLSVYKNAINCFKKNYNTVFELKGDCRFNFVDFDTQKNISVKINHLGYRGEEIDFDKKTAEKRILLLGDSFILGFGVGDTDTMAFRLGDKLKQTSANIPLKGATVINAGYAGGFGPDGYYLYLKNKGMKLKPDLVVFSVFVYNDFSDIGNNEWIGTGEFGEPLRIDSKTVKVDNAGHLVSRQTPVIYQLPVIKDSHLAVLSYNAVLRLQNKAKHFFDLVKYKIITPQVPDGAASDTNLPGVYTYNCLFGKICHRQTAHLFTDLNATILASRKLVNREYGDGRNHFLVMIIPADFQLYPEALTKYNMNDKIISIEATNSGNPQNRMTKWLSEEKINFLDLLPAFQKNPDKLYFLNDGHWNMKGNEAAAEVLLNWIKENYK